MTGSTPMAEDLRRRAGRLRRLADRLDAGPLLALHRASGPDTWVSPRAEELRRTLEGDRGRLLDAAADLRVEARRLERRADDLDAAQAALAGGPGATRDGG